MTLNAYRIRFPEYLVQRSRARRDDHDVPFVVRIVERGYADD